MVNVNMMGMGVGLWDKRNEVGEMTLNRIKSNQTFELDSGGRSSCQSSLGTLEVASTQIKSNR